MGLGLSLGIAFGFGFGFGFAFGFGFRFRFGFGFGLGLGSTTPLVGCNKAIGRSAHAHVVATTSSQFRANGQLFSKTYLRLHCETCLCSPVAALASSSRPVESPNNSQARLCIPKSHFRPTVAISCCYHCHSRCLPSD